MWGLSWEEHDQLEAEQAQRQAEGKQGMGPIETAFRAQTLANIAAHEAEKERRSRMTRKERAEENKQQELAKHEKSQARKEVNAKAAEAEAAAAAAWNPAAAQRQREKKAAEMAATQRQATRAGRARAAQRERAKAAAAAAIAATGQRTKGKEREATRPSAQARWEDVRHCEAMRRALASARWSVVLNALRENDAQLTAAEAALELARAEVATLDERIEIA